MRTSERKGPLGRTRCRWEDNWAGECVCVRLLGFNFTEGTTKYNYNFTPMRGSVIIADSSAVHGLRHKSADDWKRTRAVRQHHLLTSQPACAVNCIAWLWELPKKSSLLCTCILHLKSAQTLQNVYRNSSNNEREKFVTKSNEKYVDRTTDKLVQSELKASLPTV
jgi:hypothetical protein